MSMKTLRNVSLLILLLSYVGCSGEKETAQPAGKSPLGGLKPKPPVEISSDELVTLVLDVRYANGELVKDTNLVVLIDRKPRDRLRIGPDGKVTIGNLQMGRCQVIVRDINSNENLKLQDVFLDMPMNNVLVQVRMPEKIAPVQSGVNQDSSKAKTGKVRLD
jgi:hypothetical protein